MPIPKTIQDYQILALKLNITMLGELPENIKRKARWHCSCGYEWEGSYGVLSRTRGCPKCSAIKRGKTQRLTVSDYIQAGHLHGLEWADSLLPSGNKVKTRWRCAQGHEFESTHNDIIGGHGCKKCRFEQIGNAYRLKASDYAELARSRGFEWIGKSVPRNTGIDTQWRCSASHEWSACHRNILHGETGCPFCVNIVGGHRVSLPQRKLHKMIGGELNFRVNRYSLDIALVINDTRIAIEYDCWYWHNKRVANDSQRDTYFISRGWRILRVKSGNQLPTREQIDTALTYLVDGATYTEIVLSDWRDAP